jgi:hypothetical protein
MSQMGKNVIKLVALVFAAAVVVVGITEVAVEAIPGDVLRTAIIDANAQCSGSSGSALTVVSGGKAGFPKIPVLLVTSCVPAAGSPPNLYLLNPSDSLIAGINYNAKLVKQLPTVFPASPPANSLPGNLGWEALALRSDKADLLACGTNGAGQTVLWSVDFSPFNTISDGTATFLGNGPSGSNCNAIAWDATDKTLYQTPAAGPGVCDGSLGSTCNVFHSMENGSPLTSIPSGCTTPISGLGVAGTSLFVSCEAFEGLSTVRQVYKVDGTTLVQPFSGPTADPAGLPDDPTTFASQYKELLWTLNAASPQFQALEIPGGTIGQRTGAPVPFPGVGSGATACPDTGDNDGDGLLNCWENGGLWSDGQPGISYQGIYDGNIAHRDVVLCVTNPPVPTAGFQFPPTCADKDHPDIFVEIDYMLNHYPDLTALGQVMDVFRLAPTPPGSVRLHIQLDEQIPHNDTTALVPCTVPATAGQADFDSIKANRYPTGGPFVGGFGTAVERNALTTTNPNVLNAKALAFRYGLFVHNLTGTGNTSSGCSEIGGNDFVVSLGSWGSVLVQGVQHNAGTTDQQAGTLLHELGHTLGLRHGGGDNVNCKPNYVSVMNYTRQFSSPTSRPLDYSRGAYGVCVPGGTIPSGGVCPAGTVIGLDKSSLGEGAGINGTAASQSGVKVAWGPPVLGKVAVGSASISPTGASVGIDWNRDTTISGSDNQDINQTTSASGGCPANQGTGPNGTILEGFNDWANIVFNFRGSLDFGDGSREGFEQTNIVDDSEIKLETALALSRWVIDLKPNDPNNTIVRSVTQTVGVAIFSQNDNSVPPKVDPNALTVDSTTLVLRGTGGKTWVVPVKKNDQGTPQCNDRDVNMDGLTDRVCDFQIPANTIDLSETKVVLEGTTTTGAAVLSSDSIRVLP